MAVTSAADCTVELYAFVFFCVAWIFVAFRSRVLIRTIHPINKGSVYNTPTYTWNQSVLVNDQDPLPSTVPRRGRVIKHRFWISLQST